MRTRALKYPSSSLQMSLQNGRAENCPKKDKDPVAWFSYQKCLNQPDLIAAGYPKLAKPPRKPWWRRLLS
jgi:hypothetical protein